METGPWIAGGAARRLWFGEPWTNGDVDIWFADPMQFERARGLLDAFVRQSVLYDHALTPWTIASSSSPRPIHESSNAITYRVLLSNVTSGDIAAAQIIRTRWMKDVADIFGYFDFTVCKFATDGNELVAAEDALEHANIRRLMINSTARRESARVCPRRVIKYGLYGFQADAEIMRHFIEQRARDGHLAIDTAQGDDDGY